MHECENCQKYADCDSRCRMPVPCGSYVPKAQPPAKIHTYPEMNQKIKDILRLGDEPMILYAAARIEELETLLAAAVKDIWNFSTGNTCKSCIEWKEGRCSRPGPKDCAGYSWWKWCGFAEGESTSQRNALDKAIERMEEMMDQYGYDLTTVQECLRIVKAAALETQGDRPKAR